jgi:hypothetical protein
MLLRAQAVLERVLRRARLAFGGFRAAGFGAVAAAGLGAAGLKSPASVAMVCGAAAPGAALGLDMAGFLADGERAQEGAWRERLDEAGEV